MWRREAGGRWRVFIDIGTPLPSAAFFESGFRRVTTSARYTGRPGKAAATATLLDADRQLNAAITSSGAAAAYAGVIMAETRLHRAGFPPMTGPKPVTAWLAKHAAGVSAATTAAAASSAGDLGYSYGRYERRSEQPEDSAYVRAWTRDATGRWLVVADVTYRRP